jgi:hypothetical protein
VLQRRIRRRRRDVAASVVEAGRVRAALQFLGGVAGARQHVGYSRNVPRLAGVTRAHQRDLRFRVAEALDTTRGDERHRLQRFERAAGHRDEVRIASRVEHATVDVDDGYRAEMEAFDDGPARFDGERCELTGEVRRGACVRRGSGHDGCGEDNPPFYRPVDLGSDSIQMEWSLTLIPLE